MNASDKINARDKAVAAAKKRSIIMRGATTSATQLHGLGGLERKHSKPKPVTLAPVNLRNFDE